MREIKFRGKRVDNKEWVYGCLTRYSERMSYITVDLIESEVHQVSTDTVGQFTGLKDRAGNEVYEGYIVCAFNGKYIGEVFYQAPEFAIQNIEELRLNFFEFMPNGDLNFGVIGNKWENNQKQRDRRQ